MKNLLKKSKIKIDIGCGKRKRNDFIGLDIDKNSDADIIASALKIPFDNNNVDEVYSSHLVEHFSPAEVEIFFAEIYRVLKKGSKAFLKVDTDWTKRKLLAKDPTHKYRYSVKELKKILAKFNFSQVKVEKKIYFIGFRLFNKIFVELIK